MKITFVPASSTEAWDKLLKGYAEALKLKTTNNDELQIQDDVSRFKLLLTEYSKIYQAWRMAQENTAEDFNLIELLGLTRDENRHSDVLAWLLDRDVEKATHSQDRLGFKIFLEELGEELRLPKGYADEDYQVGRERQGEESRIDIEISARQKFVIHIEVKIGAGLSGEDQLKRETDSLRAKAELLGVANTNDVHAFFLTPDGKMPDNPGNFEALSWRQLIHVFERFSNEAKAPSVKWFAKHYAIALDKYIAENPAEEDKDEKEKTDVTSKI